MGIFTSDVTANYARLPELCDRFEEYVATKGISAWMKLDDFMFTACQYDKNEGTNSRGMSIEKMVVANTPTWTYVLNKAGITPVSGESGLPRVQQERLILDYMLWVLYVGIKRTSMPYYCCKGTPAIIRKRGESTYRSEDDMVEVYNLLAEQVGYTIEQKEESEEVEKVHEGTDKFEKMLCKFLERNSEVLPDVITAQNVKVLPNSIQSVCKCTGYTFEESASVGADDFRGFLEDIQYAALKQVIEAMSEDTAMYILSTCGDSRESGLLNSSIYNSVLSTASIQEDVKRMTGVAMRKAYTIVTRQLTVDELAESIVTLGKLYKGKNKWWRCLADERIR